MQVTSNPITEKQTNLDRQLRSKEIPSSKSPSIQSPKFDENVSERGAAQNETSQYLKVLSRVENLLIQNKLPDAAIEGFAGAVKKQIDAMTEADIQMLMKLPELKILELDNLDDIPEMIKNDIRNQDKNMALLKFLRVPEFAGLMRTDNTPSPKTYTAQTASQPTNAKHEGEIMTEPASIIEKPARSSTSKLNQNINPNVNTTLTNRVV
tara:strand:- start:36 stop:662 length:627 start_codon:yes stop_codon:yes gene_type:complete